LRKVTGNSINASTTLERHNFC